MEIPGVSFSVFVPFSPPDNGAGEELELIEGVSCRLTGSTRRLLGDGGAEFSLDPYKL